MQNSIHKTETIEKAKVIFGKGHNFENVPRNVLKIAVENRPSGGVGHDSKKSLEISEARKDVKLVLDGVTCKNCFYLLGVHSAHVGCKNPVK